MKKVLFVLMMLSAAVSCTKTGNPVKPHPKDVDSKDVFSVETSSLFEKHVDPESGVLSYILKANTLDRENSQSSYFNSKSMTEDGRFILFFYSYNEYKHTSTDRHAAIIDLKTEKIYTIPHSKYDEIPFLDTKTDKLYYVWNQKTSATFYRRDLLDDPSKEITICPYPREVYNGKRLNNACTHLTLTKDRKRAFVDARVDTETFRLGMVDLEKGTFDLWLEPKEYLYHGQICPTNDDLVLCAMSGYTDKNGVYQEMQNEGEIYPRIQIVRKGRRTTIPSQVTNYATHEKWDEQGEGIYFCSKGVRYHDLASGEEYLICPERGAHAFLSIDRNYVTCDSNHDHGSYRGNPWTVYFHNRLTNKSICIHTKTGAIAPDKEHESNLHPDAHPQFVCGDKYIICTMGDSEGNMRLCVTPVAPLIEMTSK